jgi:hypothetical protein
MNQPKTAEEFMALPVRPLIKKISETLPNGTVRERAVASRGYAICYEPDTIFTCRGYVLGRDEDGYCRHQRSF